MRNEQATKTWDGPAIENLWSKYAVTAKQIEAERDAAAAALQGFFGGVGV